MNKTKKVKKFKFEVTVEVPSHTLVYQVEAKNAETAERLAYYTPKSKFVKIIDNLYDESYDGGVEVIKIYDTKTKKWIDYEDKDDSSYDT